MTNTMKYSVCVWANERKEITVHYFRTHFPFDNLKADTCRIAYWHPLAPHEEQKIRAFATAFHSESCTCTMHMYKFHKKLHLKPFNTHFEEGRRRKVVVAAEEEAPDYIRRKRNRILPFDRCLLYIYVYFLTIKKLMHVDQANIELYTYLSGNTHIQTSVLTQHWTTNWKNCVERLSE